ncbi:hypothetical protein PoB_000956900 [Plakobranchus ocellatus]|uniref:Uncharacterized protein n=1 Tax=Plakobranchus ocellatus TaxID=259542 RepID=A0AAV3YLX8_9GAST|nr:hypothetical protein PoB_000956900 [Plakobranchus ocellatus]
MKYAVESLKLGENIKPAPCIAIANEDNPVCCKSNLLKNTLSTSKNVSNFFDPRGEHKPFDEGMDKATTTEMTFKAICNSPEDSTSESHCSVLKPQTGNPNFIDISLSSSGSPLINSVGTLEMAKPLINTTHELKYQPSVADRPTGVLIDEMEEQPKNCQCDTKSISSFSTKKAVQLADLACMETHIKEAKAQSSVQNPTDTYSESCIQKVLETQKNYRKAYSIENDDDISNLKISCEDFLKSNGPRFSQKEDQSEGLSNALSPKISTPSTKPLNCEEHLEWEQGQSSPSFVTQYEMLAHNHRPLKSQNTEFEGTNKIDLLDFPNIRIPIENAKMNIHKKIEAVEAAAVEPLEIQVKISTAPLYIKGNSALEQKPPLANSNTKAQVEGPNINITDKSLQVLSEQKLPYVKKKNETGKVQLELHSSSVTTHSEQTNAALDMHMEFENQNICGKQERSLAINRISQSECHNMQKFTKPLLIDKQFESNAMEKLRHSVFQKQAESISVQTGVEGHLDAINIPTCEDLQAFYKHQRLSSSQKQPKLPIINFYQDSKVLGLLDKKLAEKNPTISNQSSVDSGIHMQCERISSSQFKEKQPDHQLECITINKTELSPEKNDLNLSAIISDQRKSNILSHSEQISNVASHPLTKPMDMGQTSLKLSQANATPLKIMEVSHNSKRETNLETVKPAHKMFAEDSKQIACLTTPVYQDTNSENDVLTALSKVSSVQTKAQVHHAFNTEVECVQPLHVLHNSQSCATLDDQKHIHVNFAEIQEAPKSGPISMVHSLQTSDLPSLISMQKIGLERKETCQVLHALDATTESRSQNFTVNAPHVLQEVCSGKNLKCEQIVKNEQCQVHPHIDMQKQPLGEKLWGTDVEVFVCSKESFKCLSTNTSPKNILKSLPLAKAIDVKSIAPHCENVHESYIPINHSKPEAEKCPHYRMVSPTFCQEKISDLDDHTVPGSCISQYHEWRETSLYGEMPQEKQVELKDKDKKAFQWSSIHEATHIKVTDNQPTQNLAHMQPFCQSQRPLRVGLSRKQRVRPLHDKT